jgi:hypothetical protein
VRPSCAPTARCGRPTRTASCWPCSPPRSSPRPARPRASTTPSSRSPSTATGLRPHRRPGQPRAEGQAGCAVPGRRHGATELAGEPITAKLTEGARQRRGDRRPQGRHRVGVVRGPPVGTEDVYKIYAESFRVPSTWRRCRPRPARSSVELPDEAIPIEVDHTDQPVRIRVGHLKLWFRKSQTEHLRARQTLARRHGPWVGQGHHCPGLTQSRAPDDETVDLGSQVIWGAQASPQREVRGSQTGREAGCPADVHHGARCGRHRQTVEHGGPRRRTNVLADHLRGPDPDIWHEHVDSRRPVLDPRHTPEGSRGRVREHHVVRGRTLSGCGMDEGNMTSAGS